jgi:hypothetical protein
VEEAATYLQDRFEEKILADQELQAMAVKGLAPVLFQTVAFVRFYLFIVKPSKRDTLCEV